MQIMVVHNRSQWHVAFEDPYVACHQEFKNLLLQVFFKDANQGMKICWNTSLSMCVVSVSEGCASWLKCASYTKCVVCNSSAKPVLCFPASKPSVHCPLWCHGPPCIGFSWWPELRRICWSIETRKCQKPRCIIFLLKYPPPKQK